MAKHLVKCIYCNEIFDTNTEPFVKISRRYAHERCKLEADKKPKPLVEVKPPGLEALENYIIKKFNLPYITPSVRAMIKRWTTSTETKMTYEGIFQALLYSYEVRKLPLKDTPTGSLALVPYYYEEAKKYFLDILRINTINEQQTIKEIEKETVTISTPKRKPARKNNFFSFLDEEVNDGE